jgi:hypothetical protein
VVIGSAREAESSRGCVGERREMVTGSAPANDRSEIRPQPMWGGGDRPWCHHCVVSAVTGEMAGVRDRVTGFPG